ERTERTERAAGAPEAEPQIRRASSVEIDLRFEEDEDTTDAWATLRTQVGTVTGHGTARRNPVDPRVPLVGEELAAAGAVVQLAEALREAAGEIITAHETTDAHLVG